LNPRLQSHEKTLASRPHLVHALTTKRMSMPIPAIPLLSLAKTPSSHLTFHQQVFDTFPGAERYGSYL
jgi:hypothetical protein